MTLVLNHDLDMVAFYLFTKNKENSAEFKKLWPGQTDLQTDGQTSVCKSLPTPLAGGKNNPEETAFVDR